MKKFLKLRMFRYAIFGLLGASSDLLVYSILVMGSVPYLSANVVGYSLGTSISFLLNRTYTFKSRDYPLVRFVSYFLVALTGLSVSSTLLQFFIDGLGIADSVAKLLTLPVVFLLQYSLNRSISFRKAKSKSAR